MTKVRYFLLFILLFLLICTIHTYEEEEEDFEDEDIEEVLFIRNALVNKAQKNRVLRTQVRNIPQMIKTCAIFSDMVYQPSKVNGPAKEMHTKTLEAINQMGSTSLVYGYKVAEATNDYAAFVNDNRRIVIIAITGTRFGDTEGLPDMIANSKLIFKKIENSKRYKDVEQFINRMRMNYGTYRVILTGHSLGASLAEAYGRKYPNIEVVSFCSPGYYDLKEMDQARPLKHQNIYSYTVERDLVSFRNSGGREYSILKKDNQPDTVKGHHTIANFVDDKIHNIILEVKDSFKKK